MAANRPPPLLCPLVSGLHHRSVTTQIHCFSALTALLRIDKQCPTKDILQAMDEALVTDIHCTKGDKRLIASGKILLYGALLRSGRILPSDPLFSEVFTEMVKYSQRRISLLVLATPFLCQMLKNEVPASLLEPFKSLVNSYSPWNSCILKLAIVARNHQGYTSPLLGDIESVSNIVVENNKLDDVEFVDLLFSYLASLNGITDFWKILTPKLLSTNSVRFICLFIKKCIAERAPIDGIVTRGTVSLLLSAFRKIRSEFKQLQDLVKETFRSVLQWKTINRAEGEGKSQLLSVLFNGTPNVLHEYKILCPILRQYLSVLTADELDHLVGIVNPILNQEHRGRHTVSAISFLARIAQLKTTTAENKINILNNFFIIGYCTPCGEEENLEIIIRKCQEAFSSTVKFTYDNKVIEQLYGSVSLIVESQCASENSQVIKLAPKDLKYWMKLRRLAEGVGDEDVSLCVRFHAFMLITDPLVAAEQLPELRRMCLDVKDMSHPEKMSRLMSFLLRAALNGRNALNCETLFSRLLMEELIEADTIQHLVDALEEQNSVSAVGNGEDGDGSDVENESDADEGDSDSDEDSDVDDGGLFENIKTKVELDGGPGLALEDDDDETSIDLDNASEAELEAMNQQYSKLFTLGKQKKKEQDKGTKVLIQALHLVELVLKRYRSPDAKIPLMLVMPCLICLFESSKAKRDSTILPRIMSVVKRLNSLRKVTGLEDAETDVDMIVENIQKILRLKLSKDVRRLMNGSLSMISICFETKLSRPVEFKVSTRKANGNTEIDKKKERKRKLTSPTQSNLVPNSPKLKKTRTSSSKM